MVDMAILKIARMGHPVLLQRAQRILDPGAEQIRSLVADMTETMLDAEGNGLAAPQVHRSLRLILFLDADQREEEPGRRWYPVIDYSRCTNCMECIDFCLFGVYGVDKEDHILVEHQDNCKRGCPAMRASASCS